MKVARSLSVVDFFHSKINCLLDVGEARKVQKDWVEEALHT